jgi:phospholipase D1/2
MSENLQLTRLFEPGRNCWRIERANRAAFLIDADSYFKAFVAAARQAQRSILITGWDFHSRTRLLCEDDRGRELELGRFLNDLVRRKRGLQIHILIWDYPMVFGLDREWAPLYGFGWRPRRRIHFRYDSTQPVGASHHQKLVVIDDAIAFCGGIDLTCKRWDTCEHSPSNERRAVQGSPYPPFHDLTMAVDGHAAKALGDLVRERWRRAEGQVLAPAHVRNDPWPDQLDPSIRDVDLAIARSEPESPDYPGVREVQAMYLDMIAAARDSIYIENQYFTADKIGDALAARLQEPNGPEVIVVLRQLSHGWLEELTMQTLRKRLIDKCRAADAYGRFRVFYPYVDGLKEGTCIDVHAKMMIVDDRFVRIGSANLANRSMGLDTECDLCIAAEGREDVTEAIATLRSELLAEHLGFTPEGVRQTIQEKGNLRDAIDVLQKPDRTLKPLTDLPEVSDAVLSVASVADPERPVALSDLAAFFNSDVPEDTRRSGPAWGKIAMIVLVVAGLTALWKFTPLAELLEANRVTRWAREVGSRWWAPLATIFAYTPAAVTMFPRPLITLFAVVAFGPWLGFAYAMLGIELSAWLTFVAGKRLDRDVVRRVAGAKLNDIIQVLRHRGLLAITALRLVPLAPFAVEGVVAGAARVKLWHFMLGTAIGILPGTLTSTVFGDQLQAAMEDPSKVNYWLIAAVVAFFAVATWWVRRWLMNSAKPAGDEVSVRA